MTKNQKIFECIEIVKSKKFNKKQVPLKQVILCIASDPIIIHDAING